MSNNQPDPAPSVPAIQRKADAAPTAHAPGADALVAMIEAYGKARAETALFNAKMWPSGEPIGIPGMHLNGIKQALAARLAQPAPDAQSTPAEDAYVIEALVALGLVSAEKIEQARAIYRCLPDAQSATPIDMILYCPACGLQHIDAPDPNTNWCDNCTPENCQGGCGLPNTRWANPPHRSHLCHGCGHIWRPADVPTNGVAAIKTKGKADAPAPLQPQAATPQAQGETLTRNDFCVVVRAAMREYRKRNPSRYLTDEQVSADDSEFASLLADCHAAIVSAKDKP